MKHSFLKRMDQAFLMAFICFVFFLSIFASVPIVMAQNSEPFASPQELPVLAVDPPISSANLDEYFTINVNITNVEDLYSWCFRLGWRPRELLKGVSVTEVTTFFDGDFSYKLYMDHVAVGSSLLGHVPGETGSGTVVTIRFQVTDTGDSTLELYDTELFGVNTTTWDAYPINHTVVDGYFTTRAPGSPVASFTYSPERPLVNEEVTFNASASYDLDGEIVSYAWDFGDGTPTITETDPITTHTFAATGTYTVTMTVTDDDGLTDVATADVHVVLIRPIEGQWANYTLTFFDATGAIMGAGLWNLTYDHYVSPYQIYITVWSQDPAGYVTTGWMTVNIVNRQVESGIWAGMWYPGWIETNIDIGSNVNLLGGTATVVGSRVVYALEHGVYPIECWELYMEYYEVEYTFWYDKASGLWVGMEYAEPYAPHYRTELMLFATNIPLVKYKHEIAVTLEIPMILELGESSLLEATVYNIGLSNETDVKLLLSINGTVFDLVTIPKLISGASYTLSYLWTPMLEATYNVTAYAPLVSGENFTANNIATKMVEVRWIRGFVLFDQTHGTDRLAWYSTWVADLTEREYIVDTHIFGPITSSVLADYDVFVIPQAHQYYSSDELSAIQSFVIGGGGLLVVGDDYPWIYTSLTSFAEIEWGWGGCSGHTSDISPHLVTRGVTTAYFGSPVSLMYVAPPAQDLIRDPCGNVVLAVSEVGLGRVLGIADENSINDWYIGYADNLQLANNMIDWLASMIDPVASFVYEPIAPYVGDIVTFNASSSYDPDGEILSYDWDFGDGFSETGMVVTHAYWEEGNFTVKLKVTDDDGLTDKATANVTVRHRVLTLKLSGEHDYLFMEPIRIRIAALVKDSITMEPVSDVDVTVDIYDPDGKLWASAEMKEILEGTGVYEWQSNKTIRELMEGRYRLRKGVYLVYARASFRGGPVASDNLQFHIDPLPEGSSSILIHYVIAGILVSLAGVLLLRRSLHRRFGRTSR